MKRSALVLCCLAALAYEAAAASKPGIATRHRPSAGYSDSGTIGTPWADARSSHAVPSCQDEAVLGTIAGRFAHKESAFWNSSLTIARFDRVRAIGTNKWGINNLPRRGCMARALTSDGKWRAVSYTIIANNGMLGYGWGVTWCVSGRDQGWAYNPACKTARP